MIDTPQHADFNPRSREGSDPILPFKVVNDILFQSTLPRGERPLNLFDAIKRL